MIFKATSLPLTPICNKKEIDISGHTFFYYNVYNDGEGNFVLKDDFSYIKNYDIIFGLSFAQGYAKAYDISSDNDGFTLCEERYSDKRRQCYSVYNGFEIAIDRSLSSIKTDVNIGCIEHWR